MRRVDLSPYATHRFAGELESAVCEVAFPHALKPGWHLFHLKPASAASLRPRLVFDWGDGFSEASAVPLGPTRSGAHEVLVRTAKSATGLRLTPGASEHSFEFDRIEHATLGAAGVLAHAGQLVAGTLLGRMLFTVRMRRLADGTRLVFVHPFTRLRAKGERRRKEDYARWRQKHDYNHTRDAAALKTVVDGLESAPLLSVVMPVFNTPAALLDEAIQSVVDQVYPHWELCIADDGSSARHVRRALEAWAKKHKRIKLVFRPNNGHIAAATNTAFEHLATGTWVVPLDHDDKLRENALAELALAIGRSPNAQLIYSDEDKIDEAGNRSDPYFKPQFSLELFRCQNYLNHLTAIRASMVRQVGGWREGFEGAQDYDLYLRVVEQTYPANIVHIPKVLYHWRMSEGSAALRPGEKDYAAKAALKALKAHIERTGLAYETSALDGSIFYHTRPKVPDPEPLVSIIIPTRDAVDVLRPCVTSILEKTVYTNYEIVLVDNGTSDPETLAYFDELAGQSNISVLSYDAEFNFSAINNFAVDHVQGTLVVLLNNDVEVISPDWLRQMVAWAVQPEIGCVGAKLYHPDDTVQHAGVVLGIGGVAGHGQKRTARAASGYFGHLRVVRTVSAVTAACLAVRKSVYEEAGGLDEENLAVAFNDVDFCLTVARRGYRNVWTPHAELYHKESHSRGAEDTPNNEARFAAERAHMKAKWGDALTQDPHYSPNLTLQREDYSYC
ncbi:MAG: glycosyltransferase family 2 protein [Pseudomonadota bacterium]